MSKLVFIDTIRLSSEGNLIVGNKPGIVSLSDVSKLIGAESQADIQSFGLFERSTPNYATYYPEASAEDLNPKESEFIEPVFRALSAVTILSSYDAVNFAFDPEILNRSKSLLLGQSVMIDHETALGNIIGAVSEVSWQESYKTRGATKPIPAGINSVLKIDGKANPRIARAIMMDPPGIHSTTVS